MCDIYFNLDEMHQVMDDYIDSFCPDYFGLSCMGDLDSFVFDFDISGNHETDDYAVEVKKKSNGCTCESCGELYPYAEPNQKDGKFKCWGCRHF